MGLIIIQPDYSTAIMIGIIGVTILFIGGAKIKAFILLEPIWFTYWNTNFIIEGI